MYVYQENPVVSLFGKKFEISDINFFSFAGIRAEMDELLERKLKQKLWPVF
jgi:hypothetical protein